MDEVGLDDFILAWNDRQNLTTPALHLRIAGWLSSSWAAGERQLLLMAFRSSGKSTLVGLFCAWRLLCDPSTRILVMAADHALARKMVRNVKRIIERHPQTGLLVPKRKDQWAWLTSSPWRAIRSCATRPCWPRASAPTSPARGPMW